MSSRSKPPLHSCPRSLIDNTEIFAYSSVPLFCCSQSVNSPTRLRIFNPLASIEEETTDIFLVFEHQTNGVGSPYSTSVLRVESFRNCLLALTFLEQLEDLPNDCRLLWVDFDLVPDWHRVTVWIEAGAGAERCLGPVSVGSAASREPLYELTVEPAFRSLPKVIKIEFVYKRFYGNTDLRGFICCIDIVRYCDYPESEETQALDYSICIAYIAR
jgi:hypothetical protein